MFFTSTSKINNREHINDSSSLWAEVVIEFSFMALYFKDDLRNQSANMISKTLKKSKNGNGNG